MRADEACGLVTVGAMYRELVIDYRESHYKLLPSENGIRIMDRESQDYAD
jgi:hypothetical protein